MQGGLAGFLQFLGGRQQPESQAPAPAPVPPLISEADLGEKNALLAELMASRAEQVERHLVGDSGGSSDIFDFAQDRRSKSSSGNTFRERMLGEYGHRTWLDRPWHADIMRSWVAYRKSKGTLSRDVEEHANTLIQLIDSFRDLALRPEIEQGLPLDQLSVPEINWLLGRDRLSSISFDRQNYESPPTTPWEIQADARLLALRERIYRASLVISQEMTEEPWASLRWFDVMKVEYRHFEERLWRRLGISMDEIQRLNSELFELIDEKGVPSPKVF